MKLLCGIHMKNLLKSYPTAKGLFTVLRFFFLSQLLGRMGTLEESGQACLFLAAEATFTTGIDMLLSGGAELTYGKKTQVESA